MSKASKQCAGRQAEKKTCQFTEEKDRFAFSGKNYCRWHLPSEAKMAWTPDQVESLEKDFEKRYGDYLADRKVNPLHGDFTEVAFPFSLVLKRTAGANKIHARFDRATFAKDFTAEGGTFVHQSTFVGAHFCGRAMFARSTFDDGIRIAGARFDKGVDFSEAVVPGECTFAGLSVTGRATFRGIEFRDVTNFDRSDISGAVSFDNAIFKTSVSFRECQFRDKAGFSSAKFLFEGGRPSAVFERANFHKQANFRDTEFHGEATFAAASFLGEVVFRGATFKRSLSLATIHGDNDPSAPDSRLKGCDFSGAQFLGLATFENRRFGSRADFSDAKFARAPIFHGCEFHQSMTFPGEKAFLETAGASAAQSYRTLRLAMEGLSARYEAGQFYSLEQQALRNTPGKLKRHEWVLSWLYGTISSYGRNALRPIAWLALVWLSFAALYALVCADTINVCASWDLNLLKRSALFSFQQTAAPLTIWRDARATVMIESGDTPAWLLMLATFESLCGLTLISLSLLAIRWRFKRE
jgi:uncharacterized protein YjbI with pentapeptide repeats